MRGILLFMVLSSVGCGSAARDGADSGPGSSPGDGADSGTDSGTGQASYAYPGCAESTYHCPNDVTFYCAVGEIKSKYNKCQSDTDCVQLAPTRADGGGETSCVDAWSCWVVRADAEHQFRDEVSAEVERYCGGDQCPLHGDCPAATVFCRPEGFCDKRL